MLASSIYFINDLADLKEDRLHPEKKKRPLAKGELNFFWALVAAIILSLVAIAGAFLINLSTGLIFSLYFLLFVAYSFYLKHVVILDVLIIAIGFVLRVIVGAVAISVPVSYWLLICTMFLALFLGFAKRRNEIVVLEKKSDKHRKALKEYGLYFLDQMIGVTTASIIITYTLYTTASETILHLGTNYLFLTVPFVLYGIFRYLYLIHQKNDGGSPTDLVVKDKSFLINIFLWFLLIVFLIYGKNWF